jgi:hypothetical protein
LQTETENLATRYLLGELTDGESTDLEAKYFADPALFESIAAAESKLIDDFNRGRLPVEIRERFERHYLAHPARLQRSEFGGALAERIDAEAVWLNGSTPRQRPHRSLNGGLC